METSGCSSLLTPPPTENTGGCHFHDRWLKQYIIKMKKITNEDKRYICVLLQQKSAGKCPWKCLNLPMKNVLEPWWRHGAWQYLFHSQNLGYGFVGYGGVESLLLGCQRSINNDLFLRRNLKGHICLQPPQQEWSQDLKMNRNTLLPSIAVSIRQVKHARNDWFCHEVLKEDWEQLIALSCRPVHSPGAACSGCSAHALQPPRSLPRWGSRCQTTIRSYGAKETGRAGRWSSIPDSGTVLLKQPGSSKGPQARLRTSLGHQKPRGAGSWGGTRAQPGCSAGACPSAAACCRWAAA